MKRFAGSVLLLATVFWAWAVKNTVERMFDLGVLSFASVMLTSSYLLVRAVQHPTISLSTLTNSLAMASHGFVALNYAGGAYLGFASLDRPGFGAYCTIFTALWIGIGLWGAKIMDVQWQGRQKALVSEPQNREQHSPHTDETTKKTVDEEP